MKKKYKNSRYNTIRKIIYLVLFSLIIGAFIYLSNKYESLSRAKIIDFNYYYKDLDGDYYHIVNAKNLISFTKEGRHLIFIGNSNSKWSIKYAEILTDILKEMNVEAGYYDIRIDKIQKNSNYYELLEVFKNNLISTDNADNNIMAPSFYIIVNGSIKYYNIDTVTMKNKANTKDYWTKERKEAFKKEIKNNIKRYYLNN